MIKAWFHFPTFQVLNKEIQDEARRRMKEGAIDSGDEWVRINCATCVHICNLKGSLAS